MTYDLLITQRIEPPGRALHRRQPTGWQAGRIGRAGIRLGRLLGRLRTTLLAAMASWSGWSGATTGPRRAEQLVEPRIPALVFFFR